MARSYPYGHGAPKARQLVLGPTGVGETLADLTQSDERCMRGRLIEWLYGQMKDDGRFSRLSI